MSYYFFMIVRTHFMLMQLCSIVNSLKLIHMLTRQCRNPNLKLATNARACESAGQK